MVEPVVQPQQQTTAGQDIQNEGTSNRTEKEDGFKIVFKDAHPVSTWVISSFALEKQYQVYNIVETTLNFIIAKLSIQKVLLFTLIKIVLRAFYSI